VSTADKTETRFSESIQSRLPYLTDLSLISDPPPKFFEKLVSELYSTLELTAAAVWMLDGPHTFRLLFDRDLDHVLSDADPVAAQHNQQLLNEIIQTPNPAKRTLESIPGSRSNAVFLLPVMRHNACIAIVQLFGHAALLPDNSVEDRPGIHEIQTVIDTYLERMEAAESAAQPNSYLAAFQSFCLRLHRNLDPRHVAATVVNDSLELLQCDRVSLLNRHGSRWKLYAVNGRSKVNRRSSQVQCLESLAATAMSSGRKFFYPGSDQSLSPDLTVPLAAYLEQSESRMVLIAPLTVPESTDNELEIDPEHPGRVDSALVCEQFQSSRPHANLLSHADAVCNQIAIAVANAQAHHRIPLLGMLTRIGLAAAWLRGRRLFGLSLVVTLLAGLILALVNTTADYRVEGQGRLMPVVQRRVFAPMPGEIVSILVESGQAVQAGQPLMMIRNRDLTAQLLSARNRLSQKRKELHAFRVEQRAAARSGSRDHQFRLQAQEAQAQIDIEGLNQQIAHLSQQQDNLTLRAPIDGMMATFQVKQHLDGRPVERGDLMLEVLDTSGAWQLEVDVPQQRLGHIIDAQQRNGHQPLAVQFKLKSHPTAAFVGHLAKITEQTSIQSGTTGTVRMLIAVDRNADHPHRIGSDVSVKVNCGQRSLMYVLFGDVLEFGQRHFWF